MNAEITRREFAELVAGVALALVPVGASVTMPPGASAMTFSFVAWDGSADYDTGLIGINVTEPGAIQWLGLPEGTELNVGQRYVAEVWLDGHGQSIGGVVRELPFGAPD